jgi:hypothetical protein
MWGVTDRSRGRQRGERWDFGSRRCSPLCDMTVANARIHTSAGPAANYVPKLRGCTVARTAEIAPC